MVSAATRPRASESRIALGAQTLDGIGENAPRQIEGHQFCIQRKYYSFSFALGQKGKRIDVTQLCS